MTSFARSVFNLRILSALLWGFSSGFLLVLVGGPLKAGFGRGNVVFTVIGLFAFLGLLNTLRFIWAPLMDRFVPPFLDRRRGWILICQVLLVLGLLALAFTHPSQQPKTVAIIALAIAFFSASQDIVIDAYRREILTDRELGFGSSTAVNGYRLA